MSLGIHLTGISYWVLGLQSSTRTSSSLFISKLSEILEINHEQADRSRTIFYNDKSLRDKNLPNHLRVLCRSTTIVIVFPLFISSFHGLITIFTSFPLIMTFWYIISPLLSRTLKCHKLLPYWKSNVSFTLRLSLLSVVHIVHIYWMIFASSPYPQITSLF